MNIIGRAADIQCKIEEREREKGTGNDRPSIAMNERRQRQACKGLFYIEVVHGIFSAVCSFFLRLKTLTSSERRPSILGASEFVNRRLI